jgi:PAS domain S-box-containing protein
LPDTVEVEGRQAFRLNLEDRLRQLADPGEMMHAAVDLLCEHIGADRVGYSEIIEDRIVRAGGCCALNGMAPFTGDFPIESFGEARMARQRRGITEVSDDVLADPDPVDDVWAAIDTRAVVSVPLVRDGQFVASLYVNCRDPRHWTPEEVSLIEEVAARTWDAVNRARAETELRQSEARLARALDAGELGAWELDLVSLGAWRSPQHDQIFGYETMLPEWSYDAFLAHVLPEDRDAVDLAFQEATAGKGRWDFESRIRRADGQVRWIWAQGRVELLPSGEPSRMKGMVRDITDQKRTEEALRDLNETLERRVAARTAELEHAHEQLRHGQKLEAMGQLTGGVAHDFNNLLTPIIGSLDMLIRRGVGTERERRLMDGALQSAERAKTLVQRLLAFARRQPLQPTAVDLNRLVGNMAGLIASTTGPKVHVRVDLPKDLPPAVADASQLEMAILNLAVNARDAMPDGGVLTIVAAREAVQAGHRSDLRAGEYVRVSVTDTGIGMDEATLGRAIEPFFSTKGIGKGTGLGLSMVHGLALQLNGGLLITSRPGEGTSVDFWLPVSSVRAEASDQIHEAVEAPRGLGKVLLVDDEDIVRMSTADMLMDLGFEVVEAGSAEEALRLIGEGLVPDVLVTDHLMPGMSGAQLALALRRERPELPVLIVSGYADAEGIEPALPRLTKPFRNAELAACLQTVMPVNPA